MNSNRYDIIIIGAGLAGSAFAALFAHTDMRIALIEKTTEPNNTQSKQKSSKPLPTNTSAGQAASVEYDTRYDIRTVALSFGSRLIFENAGLWSALAQKATAIKNIHISDRGHLGLTRLCAREQVVPALGYVIANKDLGQILHQKIQDSPNIKIISPAELVKFESNQSDVDVTIKTLQNGRDTITELNASLLVAADGFASTARVLAGIKVKEYDYQQSAIVCNVVTEKPHLNHAYERFTASGPLAFLPFSYKESLLADEQNEELIKLQKNCFSVVWTMSSSQCKQAIQLSDQQVLAQLQDLFGWRQGKLLKLGSRQLYPLRLVKSDKNIAARFALLGNASHTLHPVAGQGFNLGLRDNAELAQLIIQTRLQGLDIGSNKLLNEYQHNRAKDQNEIIRITDGLARIFTSQFFLIRHLRNVGLNSMDLLPFIKSGLARRLMGINTRLPRFKF